MTSEILHGRDFMHELVFSATRSSGPGGQHVNKVSSRVELRFDIAASSCLSEDEKEMLRQKLARRISKDDILILRAQSERSQYDNKEQVTEKFYALLGKALAPVKKRRASKPTLVSRIKRLESKQLHAKKKARRRHAFDE